MLFGAMTLHLVAWFVMSARAAAVVVGAPLSLAADTAAIFGAFITYETVIVIGFSV